jgi:hypothetical protein
MEQTVECLLDKMDVNQAKWLKLEPTKKMNTSHERTVAKLDASLNEMKAWQKQMMACQELIEACLESDEPTSVKIRAGSGSGI